MKVFQISILSFVVVISYIQYTRSSSPCDFSTNDQSRKFHCFSQDYKDPRGFEMHWNASEVNRYVNQSCPGNATGKAKWCCSSDSTFIPSSPDLSNCSVISDEIKNMENKSSIEIATEVLSKLKKTIYGGDLEFIIRLLMIKLKPENTSKSAKEYAKILMKVFNLLLAFDKSTAWMDIPKPERVAISTKFLLLVEKLGHSLAEIENSSSSYPEENIEMYASNYPKEDYDKKELKFPPDKDEDSAVVTFPKSSINKLTDEQGIVKITFLKYNNMTWILPKSTYSGKPITYFYNLNTVVMGVSVGKNVSVQLNQNEEVKIVFKHKLPIGNLTDITCVHWNKKQGGFWDENNCSVVEKSFTQTTCSCSILSDFAVLMNTEDVVEITEPIGLMWIIITGCSISIIFSIGSCLFFIYIRFWTKLKTSLHFSLCICLLMSQLLILLSLKGSNSKISCETIAILLHFFWLTAYLLMAAEGTMIYISTAKQIESRQHKAWPYFVVPFAISIVIVVITAGCGLQDYEIDRYCWLSLRHGIVYAFVVPAAVTCEFTFVILALDLNMISVLPQYELKRKGFKPSTSINKRNEKKTKTIKDLLKKELLSRWSVRCLAFAVVLGCSWIFGILYFTAEIDAFAYLFGIFNAIQGILFFGVYCMTTEKGITIVNKLRGRIFTFNLS